MMWCTYDILYISSHFGSYVKVKIPFKNATSLKQEMLTYPYILHEYLDSCKRETDDLLSQKQLLRIRHHCCPIIHSKLSKSELFTVPAYSDGNFPCELGGYVFYGYCEHFVQTYIETAMGFPADIDVCKHDGCSTNCLLLRNLIYRPLRF